jgi:serine/threonine protein kinase
MGSPAFMSPEQARDTKQADHLSDIYSAGALLFAALTGKAPFQGTTSEIIVSVIRDELVPPRHYRSDLSPELEQVLLKAMAREPKQRYQSAREFLAALEPFLPGQSTLVDGLHQPAIEAPAPPPSETISLSSLSSVIVPANLTESGPLKQTPTPAKSVGIAKVRPNPPPGSLTKAPTGSSPSSAEAAVRSQAQSRLAAIRGAVATCVGGRASRVSCILVLDGSGGASVSVTADPPSTSVPNCVRAVVQRLRFPTFEGEPVRMNYTYRFENQDE